MIPFGVSHTMHIVVGRKNEFRFSEMIFCTYEQLSLALFKITACLMKTKQ